MRGPAGLRGCSSPSRRIVDSLGFPFRGIQSRIGGSRWSPRSFCNLRPERDKVTEAIVIINHRAVNSHRNKAERGKFFVTSITEDRIEMGAEGCSSAGAVAEWRDLPADEPCVCYHKRRKWETSDRAGMKQGGHRCCKADRAMPAGRVKREIGVGVLAEGNQRSDNRRGRGGVAFLGRSCPLEDCG